LSVNRWRYSLKLWRNKFFIKNLKKNVHPKFV
jgi:hypothetical protein